MHRLILLVLLLKMSTALAATPASAAPAAAATALSRAGQAYEAGEFATAATLLEQALATAPGCARCAHLLGKSYGRLAERAGWVEAIALARKTRDALELAATLDPSDPEVIEDLIRYYRSAPGFLGGSREKAEQLERLLRVYGGQTS